MAKYKLHSTITERRVLSAVERSHTSLDDPGFCLACGSEAHGVEPDARRYPCESCGMKAVFGAEEIMLMRFYWPAGIAEDLIKTAIKNDKAGLIDGIRCLFNCREVDVDADGRVWIADPQRGHWLNDDDLARIASALKAGDI